MCVCIPTADYDCRLLLPLMRPCSLDPQEKMASLEREVELRRSDARELKDVSEEKSQKIHLLNEQLQKVKADCAGRFAHELEMVHAQNRELSVRAADAEYKLSQARKDAAVATETARSERERAEVRLVAEVESLKARLSTLKDERSRTEKLRQSAEAQCAVYALQTQQLARELADARELAVEREHACDDADRKVSELSAQVTIALSKQQQFYRHEREMRTSLERLTIDKTRMEREVLVRMRRFNLCDEDAKLSWRSDSDDQLGVTAAVAAEVGRVPRRRLRVALTEPASAFCWERATAGSFRTAHPTRVVRCGGEDEYARRCTIPSPIVIDNARETDEWL